MLLYVKHVLPETDPPSRQIHMGAGCFIECVAVGMSNEGYETKVEYFPYGEYKIVANQLAEKPVAKITLIKKPGLQKDVLYDYIYLRGTNRKPYEGKMITREEFAQIKSLTGETSSEMIFITGEDEMQQYLDIFSKAMETTFGLKPTPMEQRIYETLVWVRSQI